MKIHVILFLFGFFSLGSVSAQQRYQSNWDSIDKRPIPTWFTDAKFGIFIHWGLYSVPAWAPAKNPSVSSKYSEWYWKRLVDDKTQVGDAFRKFHNSTYGADFKYPDFVGGFKAELFKPDEWADLFKASGAKYVVLTSKHHEGFTLWPNKESWNWNSVDVGPHRDLAGDLMKSVKAKGLRMGYYYSLYEWFNPVYKTDVDKYVSERMIPQMKDLVTSYKPDILWTDGEWEHPSATWKSTEFLSWLYNESPVKNEIVVNDRWGKETRGKHGGFYTTEYDEVNGKKVDKMASIHPWEECRGIGGSFGYNRAENLDDYLTSESVIRTLIEKVARGGNLLLDIGPAADGTIPVIMQQRLIDIGKWLNVNGEAIYGTKIWKEAPVMDKSGVHFTTRDNYLYILCTDLNQSKILIDRNIPISQIELIGSKIKIRATVKNGKTTILLPIVRPSDTIASSAIVFKVVLDN